MTDQKSSVVRWDDVRLGARVAEGATSVVFRGTVGPKACIVKRLKSEFCTSKGLARARYEFEICSRVSSPYVAGALGSIEVEGTLVQVYEDIAATALSIVGKQGALPLVSQIRIGIAIARGLDDIHKCNVIHKDVNPSNIVMTASLDRLQIIDFGISTLTSTETSGTNIANQLEGTVEYISPEQTGRLNKGVDYRTDYYGLGSTLYWLATGEAPLPGADVNEMVHRTLAVVPPSLLGRVKGIPALYAGVVAKLLSKQADQRYSSCRGIVWDLERCLAELEGRSPAASVASIGERDFSDRFEIPQKLYGRERDLDMLRGVVDRSLGAGQSEVIEISGPSGVGKSALISELKSPVQAAGGFFVSGKYDQFKKNVPLLALSQTMSSLFEYLLLEDESVVHQVRRYLASWSSQYPFSLEELVPGFATSFGLARAEEGATDDGKARLISSVQAFLRALSEANRAVVMFLDDIQWADASSLDVIHGIALDEGIKRFVLVLAYRDNEVDPSHPAIITLAKIKEAGSRSQAIHLDNIPPSAVTQMLADTLHQSVGAVSRLGQIVAHRTAGNAFFVRTFLLHMHRLGAFSYDGPAQCWVWQEDMIDKADVSDNVVGLLLAKFRALQPDEQRALMYAACIGSRFDLATLAVLLEETTGRVGLLLAGSVLGGYLVPMSEDFALVSAGSDLSSEDAKSITLRFAHDRVQQAAHSLMPEGERNRTHFAMGLSLVRSLSDREKIERVFEIADHLNYGEDLPKSEDEQEILRIFNLQAGRSALAAGAHEQGRIYFSAALRLLVAIPDYGERYRDSAMGLARCYLAMDKFDDGVTLLKDLRSRLTDPLDIGNAQELMGAFYELRTMYKEVIHACLDGLASLGLKIQYKVSDLRLVFEAARFLLFWRKRTLEYLEHVGAPDKKWALVARLYVRLSTSAFFDSQNLFAVSILQIARYSQQQHGNLRDPAFVMVLAMLMLIFRQKQSAIRLRGIAYSMVTPEVPASPLFHTGDGHFVSVVDRSYEECAEINEAGYRRAIELGDLGFAGGNAFLSLLNAAFGGYRLDQLLAMIERYQHFFTHVSPKNYFLSTFYSVAQAIRSVAGRTVAPGMMSSEEMNEERLWAVSQASAGDKCMFKVMKAWSLYTAGCYLEVVRLGRANLIHKFLPGCFTAGFNWFLIGMSLLRSKAVGKPVVRWGWVRRNIVRVILLELRWWNSFSYVFNGLREILAAELLRDMGDFGGAAASFEAAIRRLTRSKSYYWMAYAHQLLGECYKQAGAYYASAVHLRESREKFRQFGAERPAIEIEQRFGAFIESELMASAAGYHPSGGGTRGGTTSADHGVLDIESVTKATRELSGQFDSRQLVENMLVIAMENAGATHGVLIEVAEVDELRARVVGELVEGRFKGAIVDEGDRTAVDARASTRIAKLALRSRKEIIVNAASEDERCKGDAFLAQHASRSLLCMPVASRGKVEALLFLENRLVDGAFTGDRVGALRIIAAQGAISLSNARFVEELTLSARKIAGLKGQLERILEGTKLMASSKSIEAAVQQAVATVSAEIDRFRGAEWHVVSVENALQSSMRDHDKAIFRRGERGIDVVIRWQGEAVALLKIDGLASNHMSDEEETFLETLSQSLGLALRNIEHQDHLEDLVARRTLELNEALKEVTQRKEKIQAIMDHIQQGILTVDTTQRVEPEFSAFVASIVGRARGEIANTELMSVVFGQARLSSDQLGAIRETLSVVLGEDSINFELNENLLPREIVLGGAAGEKMIELDWRPMVDSAGVVSKVMITLRDVTVQKMLERRVAEQEHLQERKMRIIGTILAGSRAQMWDYLTDCDVRLTAIRHAISQTGEGRYGRMFAEYHTIKGLSRTLGFGDVASVAHDAETQLQETKESGPASQENSTLAKLERVAAEVGFVRSVYEELFGVGDQNQTWSLHVCAGEVVSGVVRSLNGCGLKLEEFDVEDRIVTWGKELQRHVNMIVTHCVNNAVDHGYVLPKERGVVPKRVSISIRAWREGGRIVLTVGDRGAGIDLGRLKKLANQRGFPVTGRLEDLLFEAGVSTADKVTITSGRGVGLAAIRSLARDLGGEVAIANRDGGGAELRVELRGESPILQKAS